MFNKFCATILYRLMGWTYEGEIPREQRQLLLVFLPHTSNWDFVVGWLFLRAENLQITIFGKDQFNFFPFKYGYKFFNVVPIKRNQNDDFVQQSVALYGNDQALWAAIAPEGTRSYTGELKSGYYYIAKQASVPIAVVGPDFQRKCFILLPPRTAFPNFEKDTAQLLEFSQKIQAKRPDMAYK